MNGLPQRVRVGRSPRHGRGLFARTRLRPGCAIGRFAGRATLEDGEHVLWWLDERGREQGLQVTNRLRFLNHSSRPNAEVVGLDLVAIRNIQPGTEILIDYGPDWAGVE